jgi:hypothetical protein
VPKTDVVLFAEDNGVAPLLEWLDKQPAKAQDKCIVRIERLAELGHDLRRPEADYLRDGIYELRVSRQGVNYRMLYFFEEKQAVLSHGLTKEGKVPDIEIDKAIKNRAKFERNPDLYGHRE